MICDKFPFVSSIKIYPDTQESNFDETSNEEEEREKDIRSNKKPEIPSEQGQEVEVKAIPSNLTPQQLAELLVRWYPHWRNYIGILRKEEFDGQTYSMLTDDILLRMGFPLGVRLRLLSHPTVAVIRRKPTGQDRPRTILKLIIISVLLSMKEAPVCSIIAVMINVSLLTLYQ